MRSYPADSKFERARAKNDLHRYFGGYTEYFVQHDVADMPTDEGAIITPIQKIAATDPSIREEVHAAWLRLAEDPVHGWFVIYYFSYTSYLSRISGQDWLPDELVHQIAERLRVNKAAYTALKRWHGETQPDGCWGLVIAANATLHSKYNITVLPEEL
ncbi:MAG: hypothetical protein RLZZ573_557 [Pseudomonadota bacterium]